MMIIVILFWVWSMGALRTLYLYEKSSFLCDDRPRGWDGFKGRPKHSAVLFVTWPLAWRQLRDWEEMEKQRLSGGAILPLPSTQDPRVNWQWGLDARTRARENWLADARGDTVQEFLEACSHARSEVTQDDSRKSTIGTVIHAKCSECGGTTSALMDDWLDVRYKLSARLGRCCSGLPTEVCSCPVCRQPITVGNHYVGGYYDGFS